MSFDGTLSNPATGKSVPDSVHHPDKITDYFASHGTFLKEVIIESRDDRFLHAAGRFGTDANVNVLLDNGRNWFVDASHVVDLRRPAPRCAFALLLTLNSTGRNIRYMFWRLFALVGVGIYCAAGLGSATFARSAATADLDLSFITIGLPSPLNAKTPFTLELAVGNKGPDSSHFRVRILLPSGIRLVGAGGLECTGTTDLTCADGNADPGFDGTASSTFVADAAGSYTVVARLTELTASDPNPANNEVSLTVNVVAVSRVLVPARFAIKPAKPVAGRPVVVTFRIVDKTSGAYVKPSSASCSVNLGPRTARVVGNAATCSLHPPTTAHGKTLRGTLAANANGTRVARRFSIRLR